MPHRPLDDLVGALELNISVRQPEAGEPAEDSARVLLGHCLRGAQVAQHRSTIRLGRALQGKHSLGPQQILLNIFLILYI